MDYHAFCVVSFVETGHAFGAGSLARLDRKIGGLLRRVVLGAARNPRDAAIFHRLSLVAFFAWVGLGADGLSSSCYGPAEAFVTLEQHPYLGIFVGLGTVITIFVIATSYSQIVELFPTGGGGYFVASTLLSPWAGMVSGCALLIDYVLTIAVSLASGADAIFSFLPPAWHGYKLYLAVALLLVMVLLNMRGIRESVLPLVPVFLLFLATHIFIILYGLFTHLSRVGAVARAVQTDVQDTVATVGLVGLVSLVLRSYSMGAGTYTGIEAVSNGIPVLREPRVQTARTTMRYMALSLAFIALGLMVGFLLYEVGPEPGKTLNAVLFERVTAPWGADAAGVFVLITLLSEATLLSVAAQSGFLDGPRVLANMSLDRWFPTRFSVLSDRLVIKNGILIMGLSSLLIMLATRGSVRLLVVLYSINVFITFSLSQLGMVRHWWRLLRRSGKGTGPGTEDPVPEPENRAEVSAPPRSEGEDPGPETPPAAPRRRPATPMIGKLLVNGVGLVLTAFILVSMVVFKFHEGGWVTLLITGTLIVLAILIRRHYRRVMHRLRRLDRLAERAEAYILHTPEKEPAQPAGEPAYDPRAKTAVLLVSGFNGTGLHTLLAVMRLFGGVFRNFIFIEIGALDVGTFKGPQEIEHLQAHTEQDVSRYVALMKREGFYAEGIAEIGVDVADEITRIVPTIVQQHPGAVCFGGKLLFPEESVFDLLLHNQLAATVQKRLHRLGIPFVILPIRV
jgi:amino acid transporter